jgi:hypothetical protein
MWSNKPKPKKGGPSKVESNPTAAVAGAASGTDAAAPADAKSVLGAWDRRSREVQSVLEEPLLRPLIDIVIRYARSTADWSRATVETVHLARYAGSLNGQLCAVTVDDARKRVLISEFAREPLGGVVSVSFDHLKATSIEQFTGVPRDKGGPKQRPADATKVVAELMPSPSSGSPSTPTRSHCLKTPSSIVVEPGTGTGALWVCCESGNFVLRLDEQSGAFVVVGVPGEADHGKYLDGPSETAHFNFPAYAVWDTPNARLLVSDSKNNRIRTISRAGDDAAGVKAGTDAKARSGWTVGTLIGTGKKGSADGSLKTAELVQPIAMAFDLWRPHILYITCSQATYIRVADLREGTRSASAHPLALQPATHEIDLLCSALPRVCVD